MTPGHVVPSLLERYSNNPGGLAPPKQAVSGLGWNFIELGPTNKDGVMQTDVVDIVINNHDGGGCHGSSRGWRAWPAGLALTVKAVSSFDAARTLNSVKTRACVSTTMCSTVPDCMSIA
jgi:hypothetical protein